MIELRDNYNTAGDFDGYTIKLNGHDIGLAQLVATAGVETYDVNCLLGKFYAYDDQSIRTELEYVANRLKKILC